MRCDLCSREVEKGSRFCPHCRPLDSYREKVGIPPPSPAQSKWSDGVLYEPEDFFTLFTSEEVGRILQVNSTRIVNKWLKEKKLRGKKVGRQWLITKAEVKRYVSPSMPWEVE